MLRQFTKVSSIFMVLTLMVTTAATALAAPPPQEMATCEQDYNVQADDWLSKLAEKEYGDPLAYPAIVEATNAAAEEDSSYATINNPDLIEIGWKLCLPATAGGMMAEDGMMAEEGQSDEMMADEEMMAEEGQSDEMMADEEMMAGQTAFTVRLENISGSADLSTPLAPGVWAVHTTADPLFTAGQADRTQGLEALAEDGDPAGLAQALTNQPGVVKSGAFNTPVGAEGPGPLPPGNAYEFSIDAAPGDHLSFATMFVQSNDLFYSPDGTGIALFNEDGTPVTGDVTGQVSLWDAGTEVNQEPGTGPDQAPRQAGPDTGEAENGPVQIVADQYTYPDTAQVILVTISAQ